MRQFLCRVLSEPKKCMDVTQLVGRIAGGVDNDQRESLRLLGVLTGFMLGAIASDDAPDESDDHDDRHECRGFHDPDYGLDALPFGHGQRHAGLG